MKTEKTGGAAQGGAAQGGAGCLGCLGMIVFFSLFGWAFLDIDDPREIVKFGFKAAAVWVGGIFVLVVLAVGCWQGWQGRRRRRRG